MGKKGNWLSAVKKAFLPSKDTEPQQRDTNSKYLFLKDGKKEIAIQERKSFKEKNRWSFRRSSRTLQDVQPALEPSADSTFFSNPDRYEKSYGNTHQNKQALAVAVATAAAAEAAVAAAQAAAQVAKLTSAGRSGRGNVTPRSSNFAPRPSREETAAIRIQAAFRGYLARRAFRTLKGLARLQALARGRVGQRQTTATMRCMQALVRAQAAVRGRRTRLCEETLPTLPRPLQRRQASVTANEKDEDVVRGRRSEVWDDSTQTVEEIQAREHAKHEAAVKRERAMAYAFSHQQLMGDQYSSKSSQLGWNWLERWMAARPWENRRPSPAKETPRHATTPVAQRQPSPKRRASLPTTPPAPMRQSVTPRTASPARRAAVTPVFSSFSAPPTRLPASASSRGHSLASSSLRDDLSVASFSGTPSYMATTESARAKLRSHSTPKQRPAATSVHSDDVEHISSCAARKRLSFANAEQQPATTGTNVMWRRSAPLQRNFSFEGYTRTKF